MLERNLAKSNPSNRPQWDLLVFTRAPIVPNKRFWFVGRLFREGVFINPSMLQWMKKSSHHLRSQCSPLLLILTPAAPVILNAPTAVYLLIWEYSMLGAGVGVFNIRGRGLMQFHDFPPPAVRNVQVQHQMGKQILGEKEPKP